LARNLAAEKRGQVKIPFSNFFTYPNEFFSEINSGFSQKKVRILSETDSKIYFECGAEKWNLIKFYKD